MAAAAELLYLDIVNDGSDPSLFIPSDQERNLLEDMAFIQTLCYLDVSSTRHKRYSKFHVCGALRMIGCKPTHARDMTENLFSGLRRSMSYHEENSVTVTQSDFLRIMQWLLKKYDYIRKSTILDFCIACDLKKGSHSLIILLGGTSGCGKSTLASLLASRLGITTVLSTDSIRHMMRNYVSAEEAPVLFASTYHAGDALPDADKLKPREKILKGYMTQAKMVTDQLDRILSSCESRRETIIVEGVHLHVDFMVEMMKKHPTCIPLLIYISNEAKHRERFAVRARYMTLQPSQNKYVKYFSHIRTIQKDLTDRAELVNIPMIDNTNVDKSLAAAHATLLNCLRKIVVANQSLFDHETGRATLLKEMYERIQNAFWRSQEALALINDKRQVDVKDLEAAAEEITLHDPEPEPAEPIPIPIPSSAPKKRRKHRRRWSWPNLQAIARDMMFSENGPLKTDSPPIRRRREPVSDTDEHSGDSGSEVSVDEFNNYEVGQFVGS